VPFVNIMSSRIDQPEPGSMEPLSTYGIKYPSGHVLGIRGWNDYRPSPADISEFELSLPSLNLLRDS
jgi:hypothetical protein